MKLEIIFNPNLNGLTRIKINNQIIDLTYSELKELSRLLNSLFD